MYSDLFASTKAKSITKSAGKSSKSSSAEPFKVVITSSTLQVLKFSFAISNLLSQNSIVVKCPPIDFTAFPNQIPEYPFDVPTYTTFLAFSALISVYKNSAVTRDMFQNCF